MRPGVVVKSVSVLTTKKHFWTFTRLIIAHVKIYSDIYRTDIDLLWQHALQFNGSMQNVVLYFPKYKCDNQLAEEQNTCVGLQYLHVSSTVFYFILIKNAIRILQNFKRCSRNESRCLEPTCMFPANKNTFLWFDSKLRNWDPVFCDSSPGLLSLSLYNTD